MNRKLKAIGAVCICLMLVASLFAVSSFAEGCPHTGELIKEVTDANCEDAGSYKLTCATCGEVLNSGVIPAKGHKWGAEYVYQAGSCTVGDLMAQKCSECNSVIVNGRADAPGHSWDDGVVTTPATCTENGVKTITCGNCGEIKTEVIPATGHNMENGVCTKCGYAEPTEPKPTEPDPTEPDPTDPNPTEPNPTDPNPTEPNPTDPNPSEPDPTEPDPTEPVTGPDVVPKTGDITMQVMGTLIVALSCVLALFLICTRFYAKKQ